MEKLDPQRNEKLTDLMQQGADAARILDGDVGEAAIVGPELECIRAWMRSEPAEKELREDLYFEARALGKVRRRLTNAKAKGMSAADTLEKQEG